MLLIEQIVDFFRHWRHYLVLQGYSVQLFLLVFLYILILGLVDFSPTNEKFYFFLTLPYPAVHFEQNLPLGINSYTLMS